MIVLIGESGSGKSSVQNYMINKYGYSKIISYTTRSPRENEIDGIDYHFISGSEFNKLISQGFFAEKAVYNGWYYGTAKKDYINSQNKIAVLTPHGIRQIKNNGIDIHVVYIKVPRRDRLIKILQRGDNIEEAIRRNLSDVGQFDGVEDESNLVIENIEYKKSIKSIAEKILFEYELLK